MLAVAVFAPSRCATAVCTVHSAPSPPGDWRRLAWRENCDALFVLADAMRPTIVPLAAKTGIPAIYQTSNFVVSGGLASYGAELKPIFKKVAQYVDKLLRGADPAELPLEQPVVFELAINLKTAATLGLTIPDSVLARADTVIERE